MFSLTGGDLIIVKDRQLSDFGDGDVVSFDLPNNIADGKRGKNGNAIIAFNSTGQTTTATIRILKGSPDDKFFNQEMNIYLRDKASYVLMSGEFIKKSGDGEGNVVNDILTMSGGFVQKIPNMKDNVEGDTEQGVSVYQIMFMNVNRSLS